MIFGVRSTSCFVIGLVGWLVASQPVPAQTVDELAALKNEVVCLYIDGKYGVLGSNEALVVPLHTAGSVADTGATFVWVISKSENRWVRSATGAGELRKQVGALRCGLDRAAWEATNDGACATIFTDVFSVSNGGPLPFDVARSHDVYLALFGQIESAIYGKNLLFVPSDLLGTLPLHTLVAEKPTTAPPTGFGDVIWLTQRHAITVLPTVASVKFAKVRKGKQSDRSVHWVWKPASRPRWKRPQRMAQPGMCNSRGTEAVGEPQNKCCQVIVLP